jgi:hypothetical protein
MHLLHPTQRCARQARCSGCAAFNHQQNATEGVRRRELVVLALIALGTGVLSLRLSCTLIYVDALTCRYQLLYCYKITPVVDVLFTLSFALIICTQQTCLLRYVFFNCFRSVVEAMRSALQTAIIRMHRHTIIITVLIPVVTYKFNINRRMNLLSLSEHSLRICARHRFSLHLVFRPV